MAKNNIAILGCGNLGIAIAEGLISAGNGGEYQLTCTRRRTERIAHLKDKGIEVTADNVRAAQSSDVLIVAVKPYNLEELLQEIQAVVDPQRHMVISVATGVTIGRMREILGGAVPVFRAMPNTATHVRESVTCLCTDRPDADTEAAVLTIFNTVGKTIVIRENLMEAATILGACGIAYALRFIRAMIQGGIQIGFDATTATAIATQTVKGAAVLLVERNEHPEQEIDKVTTPQGCTIVGLNEMEHAGFSSSLIKGIVASYREIAG